MEANSKSALNIKQIVLMIIILFTIGILNPNINLTKIAEIGNVKEVNNIKEITQESIEVAQVARYREETVTSRSSVDRASTQEELTVIENPVEEVITEEVIPANTYITIEEIVISKDMDLTQRCGISKEDFKILMSKTKADTSKFFFENSDLIYDLCEKYELNEIFFCGLIAGESGWNIAGSHRTRHNYISMMSSSGTMIKFSSVEEGLESAASLLHTKYLSETGAFYSGKTLTAVKRIFCPSSTTWTNLIYTCMSAVGK